MKTPFLRLRTWLSGLFMLFYFSGTAAPIKGKQYLLRQPDGTQVQVKVWGDEYYQRVESLDGYTLVRDTKGWINYAQLSKDGSELLSTGIVYKGKDTTIATLKKGLEISKEGIGQSKARSKAKLEAGSAKKSFRLEDAAPAPTTGSVNGVTILVDFSDVPASIPAGDIDGLFNQIGYTGYGNNGSVRDYFRDVSGNQLDFTNEVKGYYRAKKPKTYYDQPEKYGQDGELLGEILEWLDKEQNFDFSTLSTENGMIRSLHVMYAGYPDHGWSKGLWPHQSWNTSFTYDGVTTGAYEITNIGNDIEIGVVCHESGHMLLGWPDLYDTQAPSSSGLGGFCLMSWQGDNKNPVPPNAYLRWNAGWTTVTEINNVQGWFDLPSNSNTVLKYNHPTNGREYFFLEARQKEGRNLALPDEGVMIWHVDEWGWNSYEDMTIDRHYKVSLEQADGQFDLERDFGTDEDDLFKAGKVDAFNDQTLPNARWWSGAPSGLNVSQIGAVGPVVSVYLDNQSQSGACSFGAPTTSSFPATGYREYTFAHLIGTEGPDVYNWKRFIIQWDPSNGQYGLYNLNLHTYNQNPAPWVNLVPKVQHTLSQSQPIITFSGTNIPGLDGTYYVAFHGSNLVLAEINARYTIYLSNSGTTPACEVARIEEVNTEALSIAPNPASSMATIVADFAVEGAELVVANELGTVMNTPYTVGGKEIKVDVSGLQPGLYMARVKVGNQVKMKKILVDR